MSSRNAVWASLLVGTLSSSSFGEIPAAPEVRALALEKLGLAAFSLERIAIPDGLPPSLRVPVIHDGREAVLILERRSVRAPEFRLLVQGARGVLEEVPPPPSRTYRGIVEGEPGSAAAASLVPGGLVASVIPVDGPAWAVRPLRELDPGSSREIHLVFLEADLDPFTCGGDQLFPEPEVVSIGPAGGGGSLEAGGAGGDATCNMKVAKIGFDSDYEHFRDKAESSVDTSTAIVEAGLNATNFIFERDIGVTHRLSTLVVRSDPATDPYAAYPDASDFGALLSLFRSEWNANMTGVEHDLAYYLTAKDHPQYGGLAWVGVVCSGHSYAMGLGGWGFEGIYRHELGHSWNAGHGCPPESGYIMCGEDISGFSYYHIEIMKDHRDSRTCLEDAPATDPDPLVRPDVAIAIQGQGPFPIEAVDSDSDICNRLFLSGRDSRSSFGGKVEVLDPTLAGGPQALLYSPGSDLAGIDFFQYTVSDGEGFEKAGAVIVEVQPRSMVLHLPLDETSGEDAEDAGGRGHDGELRGDLTFAERSVPGRHGTALGFTAIDGEYLSIDDHPDLDGRRGITVAAWFRVDGFAGDGETIAAKGDDAWRLKRSGTTHVLKFTCTGLSLPGGGSPEAIGTIAVDDGAWHHAAGVWDGTAISLYVDGALDATAPASGAIAENGSSVHVGDNLWNGPIDEVRIYNHGLRPDEVLLLFQDGRIENPSPPDGTGGVIPGASLSWLPGPGAEAHDIYFGADRLAVTSAGIASPEYKGRRTAASYSPTLAKGTTSYWRVDEVVGGSARKGDVRKFSTAFAYTGFSEPAIGAISYTTKPGGAEIGFRTESTATEGSDPLAAVIDTGSTPTSPVFSHRSVRATTTFDEVSLAGRSGAAVAITLQARDTGYEDEDFLEIYVTDGAEKIHLLRLDGQAPLLQREGEGYADYAAVIPPAWARATLVVSSSSNSGQGSERFDFDDVRFFCREAFPAVAGTLFEEPAVDADSYARGPGGKELGFETTSTSTGTNPYAGVREAGGAIASRYLSHVSVRATTTFERVDLSGLEDVRATVVLRARETDYEADDVLQVSIANGAEKVDLIRMDGDSGLDDLATGRYESFWAAIPTGWEGASLVFTTESDSSSGSEGFDLRSVDFTSRAAGDSCGAALEVRFLRGDANGDGAVDLADALSVLFALFAGGPAACRDAADADDSGVLEIADPIRILGYLFIAGPPPASPAGACGTDASADTLDCSRFDPCE